MIGFPAGGQKLNVSQNVFEAAYVATPAGITKREKIMTGSTEDSTIPCPKNDPREAEKFELTRRQKPRASAQLSTLNRNSGHESPRCVQRNLRRDAGWHHKAGKNFDRINRRFDHSLVPIPLSKERRKRSTEV